MKKTQFLEEAERMRKAKALSGKRKQKPGGCRTVAAAVLLVLSLLTGCSRERMETRREIERILEAAESVAEDRAAAHILEKYGIEAAAEGYWTQAYNDFFAPSVNPNVVVFMEHGDRKFCVALMWMTRQCFGIITRGRK